MGGENPHQAKYAFPREFRVLFSAMGSAVFCPFMIKEGMKTYRQVFKPSPGSSASVYNNLL